MYISISFFQFKPRTMVSFFTVALEGPAVCDPPRGHWQDPKSWIYISSGPSGELYLEESGATRSHRNRYVRWRHDLLSFSIASAQIWHISNPEILYSPDPPSFRKSVALEIFGKFDHYQGSLVVVVDYLSSLVLQEPWGLKFWLLCLLYVSDFCCPIPQVSH